MKTIIEQLLKTISEYSEKLSKISENDFAAKASPEKWSRKEELGHLIDSAHTNLRRFIVSQYEVNPKIVYDQNKWVELSGYQYQPSEFLIALWNSLNLQIITVLNKIPEIHYNRMCDTGKDTVVLHPIIWLAEDYVKHMKHHLHHILQLESIHY